MINKVRNICCIGAGYVGGPTMAVFADKCPNLNIFVVDKNKQRLDAWNSEDLTKLPIFERGLDKLISKRRGKNLHFSDNFKKYISEADMIFISVNTPTKTKGLGAGKASDLKWVEASSREIAEYAQGETIVVEKSTLPVKTAQTIKSILDESQSINKDKKFTVLSNPEFLAEGSAIADLEFPDRVLIGGDNLESIKELVDIYLNWIPKDKIITTDLWSSELSKLTANAFLAQRISSINSISALCERTGANIKDVSLAIGTDKRIGKDFLNAGPGFGGSCFKKDILNLVYIYDYYGLHHEAKYWEKVVEINDWQKKRISNLIIEKLFGTVSGKKIAILGFSFKANTNDTRESPAISICKELINEGGNLFIYDPKVSHEQIKIDLNLPEVRQEQYLNEGSWSYATSISEAIKASDAIVIITEWEEFKYLNWKEIKSKMRNPSWIFDTRLIINISEAEKYGLKVWSVGKGSQNISHFKL